MAFRLPYVSVRPISQSHLHLPVQITSRMPTILFNSSSSCSGSPCKHSHHCGHHRYRAPPTSAYLSASFITASANWSSSSSFNLLGLLHPMRSGRENWRLLVEEDIFHEDDEDVVAMRASWAIRFEERNNPLGRDGAAGATAAWGWEGRSGRFLDPFAMDTRRSGVREPHVPPEGLVAARWGSVPDRFTTIRGYF